MCSAEAVSSEGSQLIETRGLLLVKHKTIEAHWVLHVASLRQRRCNCSMWDGQLNMQKASPGVCCAASLASKCTVQ